MNGYPALLLAQIDGNQFDRLIQTFAKALALGGLYAILALSFVIIFKATQTVNFAQGAIAMAGGLFLSFLVVDDGLPFLPWGNPLSDLPGPDWLTWFVNLFVALGFAALLGLVLERVAIRPMVGEPLFSIAVITLGLEIVLRVFTNDAVKVNSRSLAVPWGSDGFRFGGAFIAWSYIAVYAFAAAAFVAVFFFYRSRLGIAMRAVAFDQEAAMAQGIKVGKVFAIAWAGGAALAALAGVFAAQPPVSAQGAVSVTLGLVAFRALPAVVIGGLDSVVGALAGGLLVGAAEIFAGEYLATHSDVLGAGYQQVVPYIVMLIALIVRPYGLFGTEEVRRV